MRKRQNQTIRFIVSDFTPLPTGGRAYPVGPAMTVNLSPLLMPNVKIVVNILLAAAALGTAPHELRPTRHRAATHTFLLTEGRSKRLAQPRTRRRPVAEASGPTYTVTATAYQAVVGQTDDDPFVTADNSRIKPHYSSKTRWLALSQDLLAHWGGRFQYGDKIWVRGISPQLDGLYTVHDTMNKRHRHCLDILTHPREKFDIFTKGVKIRLARVQGPTPRLASQRQASASGRAVAQARPPRAKGRLPRPHRSRVPQSAWLTDYLATAMR